MQTVIWNDSTIALQMAPRHPAPTISPMSVLVVGSERVKRWRSKEDIHKSTVAGADAALTQDCLFRFARLMGLYCKSNDLLEAKDAVVAVSFPFMPHECCCEVFFHADSTAQQPGRSQSPYRTVPYEYFFSRFFFLPDEPIPATDSRKGKARARHERVQV